MYSPEEQQKDKSKLKVSTFEFEPDATEVAEMKETDKRRITAEQPQEPTLMDRQETTEAGSVVVSGPVNVVSTSYQAILGQGAFSLKHMVKLNRQLMKEKTTEQTKNIQHFRDELVVAAVDKARQAKAEERFKRFLETYKQMRKDFEKRKTLTRRDKANMLLTLYDAYAEDITIYRAMIAAKVDEISDKKEAEGDEYKPSLAEKKIIESREAIETEKYLRMYKSKDTPSAERDEYAVKAGIQTEHTHSLARVKRAMKAELQGEEGMTESDKKYTDKGLTAEQKAALAHAERWILHQFYQRSLLIFKDFGHTDADRALEILRRSKTEQLIVFYAIEKGIKTDLRGEDVVAAREYVPDLKVLKSKMLTYYSHKGGAREFGAGVMRTVAKSTLGEIVHWEKIEAMLRVLDRNEVSFKEVISDRFDATDDKVTRYTDDSAAVKDKKKTLTEYNKRGRELKIQVDVIMSEIGILTKKFNSTKDEGERAELQRQINRKSAAMSETIDSISELNYQKAAICEEINQEYTAKHQENRRVTYRKSIFDSDFEFASEEQKLKYERIKGVLSDAAKYLGLAGQFGAIGTDAGSSILTFAKGLLEIPGVANSAGSIFKIAHLVFDLVQLDAEKDELSDDGFAERAALILAQSEGILNTFTKAVVNFAGFSSGAQAALAPVSHVAGLGAGIGLCCDVTRLAVGVKGAIKASDAQSHIEESIQDEQLKKIGVNAAKMSKRYNVHKAEVATIDSIGHIATLTGTLFPAISTACTVVSVGAILTSMVTDFIAKRHEKDDAIDDYMGLNKWVDRLIDEGKIKVDGRFEKKKYVKEVRQMALSMIGFSSYDQMFEHLTNKYANTLYKTVFFKDNGDPIYAHETDIIEMRAPLAEVLTSYGLRVKYPKEGSGKDPKPSPKMIIGKLRHEI